MDDKIYRITVFCGGAYMGDFPCLNPQRFLRVMAISIGDLDGQTLTAYERGTQTELATCNVSDWKTGEVR